MKSKPTTEEIIRHKELVRHYQNQIYKLTSQQNIYKSNFSESKPN